MFEKHSQPIVPNRVFVRRQVIFALVSLGIIALSLLLGILGFRYAARMSWIDALENAAMILAGMGLVGEIVSTAGKLFASFYALFAGIVFLVAISLLVAPALHRLLHHFHLDSRK